MDELLVKYLLQEATPEEIKQVEDWVAESETNQKELDHFAFLLNESQKIAAASTVNEQAAWQRFQQRAKAPRTKTPVLQLPKSLPFLRIAAILLLLITGGWLLRGFFRKDNPAAMAFVQTTTLVKADTLPDGSVVTLNKNSSIEYKKAFNKGETRAVALKGEAFFNVTPDKEKPFIIQVNNTTVKVVGTSFNVKTINGKTEVIVKTGTVEVTQNGKTVRLTPNEKTVTQETDSLFTKTTVSDNLYNYYQSREFVCDNTPLWRLVEVLNEAYNSQVVIGRDELRSLRLNTTFSNESLDAILDIVAQTFQLQVVKKGNQIILQ
jgi:transmembrane sensor